LHMGSLHKQRRMSKPPGPAICSSHPISLKCCFFNIGHTKEKIKYLSSCNGCPPQHNLVSPLNNDLKSDSHEKMFSTNIYLLFHQLSTFLCSKAISVLDIVVYKSYSLHCWCKKLVDLLNPFSFQLPHLSHALTLEIQVQPIHRRTLGSRPHPYLDGSFDLKKYFIVQLKWKC